MPSPPGQNAAMALLLGRWRIAEASLAGADSALPMALPTSMLPGGRSHAAGSRWTAPADTGLLDTACLDTAWLEPPVWMLTRQIRPGRQWLISNT
jgi:hypothetical protein